VRNVQHIPLPVRCVLTGALGPRNVDKALAIYTLAGTDYREPLPLTWRRPFMSVKTGPVILLDGPTEDLLPAHRALHETALPGLLRRDGPLRSYGTSASETRLLLKLYFTTEVCHLTMVTYGHARSSPASPSGWNPCSRMHTLVEWS